MNAFLQFFVNLKDAKWGFGRIIEYFKGLNSAVSANEHIAMLIDKVVAAVENISMIFPYIVIAVFLIECLFGKKLLNLQKFLASFIFGYAIGVHYLTPLVHKVFDIKAWIVGLVIGIVAAVLCKIVYILAVMIVSGYGVYVLFYSGTVLTALTSYTAGKWVPSLVVGAVAIVIVLLLLRYIEMLGTAFLGAWVVVKFLNLAISFTDWSWLAGTAGVIVYWVIIGIIALLGLIVQFRTRRRY